MKDKNLSIIDKIELFISDFIDYDNQHHCFRPFVLGFCTATIIVQITILVIIIKMS